ncbi:type IV pilus modification protein PilV [Guyparkeria halophila]|uniref:Type IV pilus modification protein PilV n=1 Tax=Guyparkeria halophila TaxID=47960 RepID=A0ABZ0YZE7_9GAMM|nr:type IV pilus modification protein PilV [Guyparkeria halophila]WQH16586.1 type IV pilus modification protein PilV [Guyparkeria halophila]
MPSLTPAIRSAARQSGVGLIEILIAVLILSVGFLGMAALQSKALSNNNSAMARSMGTIASYSILDAMRIDPDGVEAGNYEGADVEVPANGNCAVGGGDLAGVNLQNWCQELAELVGPGTTGTITALGGGNYRITIEFDDSRATGGEDAETLVTQAKL